MLFIISCLSYVYCSTYDALFSDTVENCFPTLLKHKSLRVFKHFLDQWSDTMPCVWLPCATEPVEKPSLRATKNHCLTQFLTSRSVSACCLPEVT